MAGKVTPVGAITIPHTDIRYAPCIKAGNWVFLNGIEAVDYERGLHPTVAGTPGLPHHGLPRNRREGDVICARFKDLLAQCGTSFANTVRLDQYYPTWKAVDPYHLARRAAFGDYIPPSTSVIMDKLMPAGVDISASLLAVTPGGGREPQRVVAPQVTAPVWSGFAPAVTSGDFIFIAGQMARGADNNTDPRAHVPPHSRWGGYEIRRQTEYLIREKFIPALTGAGSSLANAVKAQVYLRDIDDTAHFLDVWEAHFGKRQMAITIVPTKDFGLVPGIIEINLVAVTDNGKAKKQVIDGCVPQEITFGAAAVKAGDLLFCSGLLAVDGNGPIEAIAASKALPHHGIAARAQMQYIVDALKKICAAGGTDIANVTRIHQFHADLSEVPVMYRPWHEALDGAPVPFTAIGVPATLPVPASSVMVDPWVYAP